MLLGSLPVICYSWYRSDHSSVLTSAQSAACELHVCRGVGSQRLSSWARHQAHCVCEGLVTKLRVAFSRIYLKLYCFPVWVNCYCWFWRLQENIRVKKPRLRSTYQKRIEPIRPWTARNRLCRSTSLLPLSVTSHSSFLTLSFNLNVQGEVIFPTIPERARVSQGGWSYHVMLTQ